MLHKLATMFLGFRKKAPGRQGAARHGLFVPRSPFPDYALNTAQAFAACVSVAFQFRVQLALP